MPADPNTAGAEVVLLPCPFCGGDPTFSRPERRDENRYTEMRLDCDSCEASVVATLGWNRFKSMDEAAIRSALVSELTSQWNRRTPAAPPAAGAEVVVPREPTPEMVIAGREARQGGYSETAMWDAMVAAAPALAAPSAPRADGAVEADRQRIIAALDEFPAGTRIGITRAIMLVQGKPGHGYDPDALPHPAPEVAPDAEGVREAALIDALRVVRKRERSALVARGGAFAPDAAGALFDVAELLANMIDPSWQERDAEEGPFALLRDALPSTPPAASEDTARLREAVDVLLAKLDAIHADGAYQSVWVAAQLRFGPYAGPTYVEEVAALRRARAALTPGCAA